MARHVWLLLVIMSALTSSAENVFSAGWRLDHGRHFDVAMSSQRVTTVELSAYCRYLAAGFASGEVSVLRVDERDARPVHAWRAYDSAISDLSFTPCGLVLAAASGNRVSLWTVAEDSPRRLWEYKGSSPVDNIEISPDARLVALTSRGGDITLLALDDGREIRSLKGHRNRVLAIGFDKFMRHLLTVGTDGTIRTWGIDSGHELRQVKLRYFDHPIKEIRSATISPDGRRTAVGCFTTVFRMGYRGINEVEWINIYDDSAMRLRSLGEQFKGVATELAISNNAELLVSFGQNNTIRLWDIEAGTVLTNIENADGLNMLELDTSGSSGLVLAAGGKRIVGWGIQRAGEGVRASSVAVLDPKLELHSGREEAQMRKVASVLTDAIRQELHDSGRFKVMTSTHLTELIGWQRLQKLMGNPSEVSDEPKLRLSVDFLVASRLTQSHGTLHLSVTMIDVGSGVELDAASEMLPKGDMHDVPYLGRVATARLTGAHD